MVSYKCKIFQWVKRFPASCNTTFLWAATRDTVLIFINFDYVWLWCKMCAYLTWWGNVISHYDDVIMSAVASQITSLTIVCSMVYLGADQRKHESSASLAFVRGIHRGPVNSPHKWPVTRKMFPFDDVIMIVNWILSHTHWPILLPYGHINLGQHWLR